MWHYLCADGVVQRGKDLIDTLNQAAESDAHGLQVDEDDRKEWKKEGEG